MLLLVSVNVEQALTVGNRFLARRIAVTGRL
jgi:hypothetical protein